MCLQLEEVHLRCTTNGRAQPSGGQHDAGATVNAGNLQRLQNRIVAVQRDTDDDVAGQVDAEHSAEGHYSAHRIPGEPLDSRSQDSFGGH